MKTKSFKIQIVLTVGALILITTEKIEAIEYQINELIATVQKLRNGKNVTTSDTNISSHTTNKKTVDGVNINLADSDDSNFEKY